MKRIAAVAAILIVLAAGFLFYYKDGDLVKGPGFFVRLSAPAIIDLQPMAGMPEGQYKAVYHQLQQMGINVVLLPPAAMPAQAYYAPRGRYRADSLLKWLSRRTGRQHVALALTATDISATKGDKNDWGVIGLGQLPGNACIVSSFRLKKSNIVEQLVKICVHEIGHTQGLQHCPAKSCYMRDAEGRNVADDLHEFCASCEGKIYKAEGHLFTKGMAK